jgi:hypothetical protein
VLRSGIQLEIVAVGSCRVRDVSLHRDYVSAVNDKIIDRTSILRGESSLPRQLLKAFSWWVAANIYAQASPILAFATKVATHTFAVTFRIGGVAVANDGPAIE